MTVTGGTVEEDTGRPGRRGWDRAGGLVARYDAIVCDLDGVVYRGAAAVRARGGVPFRRVPIQFATNNASRSPAEVAEHLRELGLDFTAEDVATSWQAGAWLLTGRLEPGSPVLAVGAPAWRPPSRRPGCGRAAAAEATEAPRCRRAPGLRPRRDRDRPGRGRVCRGRRRRWAATNTDPTLPTERGVRAGQRLAGGRCERRGRAPARPRGREARPHRCT